MVPDGGNDGASAVPDDNAMQWMAIMPIMQ